MVPVVKRAAGAVVTRATWVMIAGGASGIADMMPPPTLRRCAPKGFIIFPKLDVQKPPTISSTQNSRSDTTLADAYVLLSTPPGRLSLAPDRRTLGPPARSINLQRRSCIKRVVLTRECGMARPTTPM